jgi:hypothetical protein
LRIIMPHQAETFMQTCGSAAGRAGPWFWTGLPSRARPDGVGPPGMKPMPQFLQHGGAMSLSAGPLGT